MLLITGGFDSSQVQGKSPAESTVKIKHTKDVVSAAVFLTEKACHGAHRQEEGSRQKGSCITTVPGL